MPEKKYKIEDLKSDLCDLKESQFEQDRKINVILYILQGSLESDEPGGLVFKVSENTRFRKGIVKVVWAIFMANAGLLSYIVYIIIMSGG